MRILATFGVLLAATSHLVGQTQPVKHSFGGTCTAPDAKLKTPVRLMLWQHDYNRESATVVADVLAGADGTFQFDRVPWLARHDWGFGFFMLHAQQGPNVAMVMLRGDEAAREPLAVELKPSVTIRGRVVGPDGCAVPNAEVTVLASSGAFFAAPPPALRVRTDARGEYVLKGVPPGPTTLVCVAEQFALARLDRAAGDTDFALEPGAVIAGRVRGETGKPAVRVRVCAQGQKTNTWATTYTDDDGRYRLIGLVGDRYNVWIAAPDLTCAALDGQPAELGGISDAPDITVVTGGFFVGRVVDADTGKPVRPGDTADVAIYGPSRPRSGAGCHCEPIAPDGSFRIRVAPGDNYIYLRGAGAYTSLDEGGFTLPVSAGGETKVEFRVRRAKQ